jgi:hypothetical protein
MFAVTLLSASPQSWTSQTLNLHFAVAAVEIAVSVPLLGKK